MKINQLIVIGIACLFSALIAVGLFSYFDEDKVYAYPYEAGGFETAVYDDEDEDKTSTMPFDFTKAARLGLPAVVHIRSTVEKNSSSTGNGDSIQDLFEDFFGGGRGGSERDEPRRGIGFGSGVIISSDGYIITNHHVIEDANDIKITFYNDEIIDAKLVGADPTTDIALVKVEKSNLPYLQFADSDQLEVGEWVAAIGNPAVGPDAFALKSTVTAGIVSATGRNIDINQEQYKIESFIQTDAVINKGNSGGALVNANGDLVGINTAISTPTGVYAGYGFAVPSNLSKKVVTDLREFGEVKRALLGVTYQDISAIGGRGGELDTKEKEGLLIVGVSPDSGADKAGLVEGDVIISVDGIDITDQKVRNFQEIIARKRPGETVNIRYKRNSQTRDAVVTLLSAEETIKNNETVREANFVEDLGVRVKPNNKSSSNSTIVSGVEVTDISRNSPLFRFSSGKVRPGFIITSVNEKGVSSAKAVKDALKAGEDGMVTITGYPSDNESEFNTFTFPIE